MKEESCSALGIQEAEREEGAREEIHPSRACAHWPTSYNQVPPHGSPFSHQWINGLMRLEPSWSNHCLKAQPLNLVALRVILSTHELLGDLPDLNHNRNWESLVLGLSTQIFFEGSLLLRVSMCERFHSEHTVKTQMILVDIRQVQLVLWPDEKALTVCSLLVVNLTYLWVSGYRNCFSLFILPFLVPSTVLDTQQVSSIFSL